MIKKSLIILSIFLFLAHFAYAEYSSIPEIPHEENFSSQEVPTLQTIDQDQENIPSLPSFTYYKLGSSIAIASIGIGKRSRNGCSGKDYSLNLGINPLSINYIDLWVIPSAKAHLLKYNTNKKSSSWYQGIGGELGLFIGTSFAGAIPYPNVEYVFGKENFDNNSFFQIGVNLLPIVIDMALFIDKNYRVPGLLSMPFVSFHFGKAF